MIRWVTAFLDTPAAHHDRSVEYWAGLTGSAVSTPRGDTGEFATLLPPNGDAFIRVQRVDAPEASVHLDFHVANISHASALAVQLGARQISDHGYRIMQSPGGFTFCIVEWHGEATRPAPAGNPASLVDQVCLDIPPQLYDEECRFWEAFTSWKLGTAARAEFRFLNRPDGMPVRLLLQRLEDDKHSIVTAHIDVAAGSDVPDVVSQHLASGARFHHDGTWWTTLLDPAGRAYCITPRDPTTGLLAT
jgi:hypothetical protein